MVWRIGEVLRLQAKCESWLVDDAALSGDRSIEMVPRVKLYSGLRGEHSQNPSRSRLVHFRCLHQPAFRMVQYKVVVVSHPQPQLFVIGVNPFAYDVRCSKIEWCALHRLQFSNRNKRRIDWRKPRCIDLHSMPKNFALPFSWGD